MSIKNGQRTCTQQAQKSVCLSILFYSSLIFVAVTSQELSSNGTGKAGVYALPEISLKLKNGILLDVEPNSPVKLSQEVSSVLMTCTADYPVKWEYLVNNKSIPLLDVVYRRLIRNISDFNNPKRNRFMSMITLRGLLESQTGKYLCRLYNEKLNNNSYAVASYYDIFVPGNRTFNTIPSVSFINKNATHVDVHCPVTDHELHVRLYKLNDQQFNNTGAVVWKPIYANYEPTDGFRLLAGLGRELRGTYNCTADNGASVISVVADLSQKEHYQSLSPSLLISVNSFCRGNYKLVQYIRSRRLECFCKDSYGLFMNDNYDFENRQANCSSGGLGALSSRIANCSDWRLEEFIANEEDSHGVCFRDGEETATKFQGFDKLNGGIDVTGSRPSLKVTGKTFPNGDHHRNFPFTKLSITYNGFVNWAGDFMLGVCRKEFCHAESNDESRNRSDTDLEYFENEPTRRQYFPMAHYQAVWNDLFINGTDVRSLYVLQAHSLSYAWFPYATAKIEWEKQESSVSLGMMSTSSSCPTFRSFMMTTSYTHYYIFISFALLFTLVSC